MKTLIKENDLKDEIEIVLSSAVYRNDQDVEDEVNELNKSSYLDNSNIKNSSIYISKFNESGTPLFTKTLQK